jgi:hypothetical protein
VEDTPFEGVVVGSIAFSDVDGDGDEDVLISGRLGFGLPPIAYISNLYTNDGGNFTLVEDTPFEGVWFGSSAFSDVDGDGDEDLLITGYFDSTSPISKLYINDGGFFTLVEDTPFENVRFSSIAFSDIDGDGDQDLLITGSNSSYQKTSNLYTNDGGTFTLVEDVPFDKVEHGSIAFSDVDGDGDQDLLITGSYLGSQKISNLYTNDGSGNFRLKRITPFDGVDKGSVAFSDIDGDGDEDVLITGSSNLYPFGSSSKLYTNDGGEFTLIEDTPFEGVYNSSIAFSDVDGDGDEDVLITGQFSASIFISNLYTNDGGEFTLVEDTPFEGVFYSSIAFSDIDGDGDEDVLITGKSGSSDRISNLYTNEGGIFTLVEDTPFLKVEQSCIAFSDIDGDGDEDVLITGSKPTAAKISKLYKNNGSNFGPGGTPFEGVSSSSIAFSDVDGDGDEDVLITGYTTSVRIANLYINDGGNFTLAEDTPFEAVGSGSIAFSDVDGDGDEDVLITGRFSGSQPSSKLYSNDGGNFTLVEGMPFEAVGSSSIAFSDVDGDGDEDVLITGENSTSQRISKLYRNITGDCLAPFLAVDEGSLSTTLTGNAAVTAWAPAPGQVGCQIQVRLAGGATLGAAIVGGAGASGFNIPFSALLSGNDYEWRVRCGCSQTPLIAGAFTSWQPFSTPGGAGIISSPNPTSGQSNVTFTVAEEGTTTLEVYDMSGRMLDALFNGVAQANNDYRFQFDGSTLPNGVYIYRLTTEKEMVNEKFMIAR